MRENFQPSTEYGAEDGDGRAMRYLAWTWDSDPTDTTYITDYVYVLRDQRGQVETGAYSSFICVPMPLE